MNSFGRRSVVSQLASHPPPDDVRTRVSEDATEQAPTAQPGPSVREPVGSADEKYEIVAPIGRGGMGEVLLHRFEDRRGVLHLGEPRVLGRTPAAALGAARRG